jgi:hypothetical protein
MRIIVEGVPNLTEPKQQELGQSILVGMFHAGIEVDGVSVEFETGETRQEGYGY